MRCSAGSSASGRGEQSLTAWAVAATDAAEALLPHAGTEVTAPLLARGDAVLAAVRPRRDSHDQAFAAALAAEGADARTGPAGTILLEDLLHTAACRRARLAGVLFHKRPLDRSPGGHDLSPDVAAAIDDTACTAVVACVLNTIDDALDRSDPRGGGVDE